jgi:hypothetical protein
MKIVDIGLQGRAIERAEEKENEWPHDKNGKRDRFGVPSHFVPLDFHVLMIARKRGKKQKRLRGVVFV